MLMNRESGWLVIAALVAILAPLTEELAFRGFFYAALRHTMKPRAAVLITSVLFGVVHFAPPTTILPMCVFGLFLATLMERTGSYLACVVAHAVFNGTTVLTILLLT